MMLLSNPYLLMLVPSCIALYVFPTAESGLEHTIARTNQQLTNPDNEPVFTNAVTGATIQKSRVLSGVGPAEADERWFDWDETCTDPLQRAKIIKTFRAVIDLARSASWHLQNLPPSLQLNDELGSLTERKYLLAADPAFAQMFNADLKNRPYIRDTFDLVVDQATLPPARRTTNTHRSLRFICDKNGIVRDGVGGPHCGTDSQAITILPYDPARLPTIEGRYSFQTSSSITFCPPFFDDHKFPNLDHFDPGSDQNTLDKVDCAERILLHEYMHLEWIRNMPPKPDYIGWAACNTYATKGWRDIKVNPDNYAWFALYAYFNQGCARDAWPAGTRKKIRS